MRNAVFVAPYLAPTTLRFVNAMIALPGARIGLVTSEKPEKIPVAVRSGCAAIVHSDKLFDTTGLADSVRTVRNKLGSVDRIVGAMEELQGPVAEVRQAYRIPGMDPVTAANFRDKSRMKSVFEREGVPCGRHRLVSNRADVATAAKHVGFPMVVKPPAGSGAKSTYRLNRESDLVQYIDSNPPSPEAPALFEEFLQGDEHSFDSVVVGGRAVWYSVSDYSPTPLEVLENRWIQWVVVMPREIESPVYDGIRGAAGAALEALGLRTGLSHMEWFRRPDGTVAISEVAARPPGAQFTTLISYACDFDLYHAWARLMVFEEFDPPARPYAAGAAFLRGQGRGKVKAIHGLEEARKEFGDVVVEAKLPRRGQAPSSGYEGEGFVVVRHPETEVVSEALKRMVSLIRVELG